MKRLLLILILTLSYQSLTKADDIRDFQIEGISIGDSLLDFYSRSIIKDAIKNTKNNYKDKSFYRVYLDSKTFSFKKYDGLNFHMKKNDNNYIIYSITGLKFYKDIDRCYIDKKNIVNDLKNLFPQAKIQNVKKKHSGDKSGKSKTDTTYLNFKSYDNAGVACYDWSKKMNFDDNLRIFLDSSDFRIWINNKAWE